MEGQRGEKARRGKRGEDGKGEGTDLLCCLPLPKSESPTLFEVTLTPEARKRQFQTTVLTNGPTVNTACVW